MLSFKKTYTTLSLLVMVLVAFGQEQDVSGQARTITSAKMVGVGWQSLQDTYLSPLHYNGMDLSYISHTVRECEGKAWSRIIINEGNISRVTDKADKGAMISGSYHFEYGAVRSWQFFDDRLTLSAGGEGDVTLGVIYNTRGGNNLAQARASLNIGPKGRASYALTKDITLNGELSAPLAGICFSPNYGQSYYEIFTLGNYDHNAVPTTFLSTPSLRMMVTADITFLKTRWRLGWSGNYHQQKVNNLKQHVYSNDFIIGIVRTIKYKKP